MGECIGPVAENVRRVLGQIEEAARRAGRDPATVQLVAVTKTVPVERIRQAYDAGLRRFGENYVQQALEKVDRLPRDAQWHMIGHLQSNKAKRAVEVFSLIHSLDRPSLADALEKAARARGQRLEVLLQVNVGEEPTKFGTSPEGAVELARRAGQWPSLRIRGLMAIPPYREDPEEVRPYFRALRELAGRLRAMDLPGVAMDELSMGMSHDFPVAVEEGATLVRVGSALFGARPG
ncbi:MAG: YggS family pyridoxal phosphate-dependent enzyme [Deferrisomatales bacterium]